MAITSVVPTPGEQAPPPPAGRGGRRTPYLLLLPGMGWLAVFFAVPILFLFTTSLQVPVPGGDVGAFQPGLRFANYIDAVSAYEAQFFRAFLYAGVATLIALLISYPLAYMIAFKSGRYRNFLLVLVVAPFFTSFILRTLAWRQILAEEGIVVRSLKWLHVLPQDIALTASAFAVVAGITYNFLPFMTLPIYASLERIDPRLIEAGGDLYGNGLTVLRTVTLPLSMPGVVAGTLLTFIPAAGDYVNPTLLGNSRTSMRAGSSGSRTTRPPRRCRSC
jgi:spermidine/putrescine transport system permease protein